MKSSKLMRQSTIFLSLSLLLASFSPLPAHAAKHTKKTPIKVETPKDNEASECPMESAPFQVSNERLEKVWALKMEFMDKLGPKMVELREHKRALEDLLTQTETKTEAIKQEQENINRLSNEIGNMTVEHRIAVISTMKPEQRQMLRHFFLRSSVMKGMGLGSGSMLGMRSIGPGPMGMMCPAPAELGPECPFLEVMDSMFCRPMPPFMMKEHHAIPTSGSQEIHHSE